MTGRLENRVAMVTGGGGALGIGLAEAFVREGARVIVADISASAVESAREKLGPTALGVVMDISRRNEIAAAIDFADRECGGLDVLVNNAGYFDMAALADATEEQFDQIFAVNVKGLFFATQLAAAQMIMRSKRGKIINIASEAGRRGEKYNSLYSASKAAVISLTQSLGMELIAQGIQVNAISPGVIDTPMLDRAAALVGRIEGMSPELAKEEFRKGVPFGRLSRPEDLAGCAVFLASSESDYIVGQTYNVDGGRCMN